MKLICIVLALACANTLKIRDVGTEMTLREHHSAIFAPQSDSPYSRCLHYVEDINHEVVALVKLILDKKFDKIAPLAIKIAELGQLAIECFMHPSEELRAALSIDPQCAIDHLKKAGNLLREIINDILHQHWHDVPEHFNQMVAILEDIKNC